jgi:NADPH:quinone reductase-like Zn-dependent oxidoreductase
VQLAQRAGLRVIATAGPHDLYRLRRLGAQEVIDYHAGRFEDRVGSVDAVIDLVGGEVQARSFAVLKPGGILVSKLIGAGDLSFGVGEVLPLAEPRIAHEMLEGLRPKPEGKIVLRVAA